MTYTPSTLAAVWLLAFPAGSAIAELNDFIEFDEEQTAAFNDEVRINADIIWVHKDFEREDSAPRWLLLALR